MSAPDEIPLYLHPANVGPGQVAVERRTPRPSPGTSLLASAQRLTQKKIDEERQTVRKSEDAGWQADAWDVYDVVGEQRFLATTLAGRLAQAKLYVAVTEGDETNATDDPRLINILSALGGGSEARISQHLYRMAVNLFIAGEVWMVGIPQRLLTEQGLYIVADDGAATEESISDLDWHVLSTVELRTLAGGQLVEVSLSSGAKISASADELYLVRIWRPHPNKGWRADSPTRSSLPVLRELVGLTQAVSAQIDSRLAGAGLLLVPSTAAQAMKSREGVSDESDEDPFTDALIEAMITPITDRDSASAVVPLVIVVPDEATDKFKHISFASPVDEATKELRDEAIHRLAIGQDAPPELLMGVGGMNHWGAWMVREDTVSTHLEPPLALICDALTSQYLHPVMRASGQFTEDEIRDHVIWYDVDHLIIQPTRAEDAERMYDKGLIDDKTMRDIAGFDESVAPEIPQTDIAAERAIQMVERAPSLMADPGLPALVAQLRAVYAGEDATTVTPGDLEDMTGSESVERIDVEEPPASSDGGPPVTSPSDAPGADA